MLHFSGFKSVECRVLATDGQNTAGDVARATYKLSLRVKIPKYLHKNFDATAKLPPLQNVHTRKCHLLFYVTYDSATGTGGITV